MWNVKFIRFSQSVENPMDYLELNTILSFAACETRSCVNVTIVDDLVDEPDLIEFFHYTLERTPGLDPRISLDPVDGVVEIIDDDGKYSLLYVNVYCSQLFHLFSTELITVGYEFTVYTTSEGQGIVELSVIIFDSLSEGPLPGGALRPFTLSGSTGNGTAGMCTLLFIEFL